MTEFLNELQKVGAFMSFVAGFLIGIQLGGCLMFIFDHLIAQFLKRITGGQNEQKRSCPRCGD